MASTTPNLSHRHAWQVLLKAIAAATLGMSLLSACVAPPPMYDPDTEANFPQNDTSNASNGASAAAPADANAAQASATPEATASPTADASSSFNFPQETCGDRAAQPSGNWYIVFIDGANLDDIRSKYCRDAVSAVRDRTGQSSVQVASFTDYDRASKFAQAVGGEVESASDSTAQANQPTPTPSATPQAAASPGAAQASQSPRAVPGGDRSQQSDPAAGASVVLTASDPDAQINIRASASTAAPVQYVGRAGEPVQITDRVEGSDGYTWYNVRSSSGTVGWVRGDLVNDGSRQADAAGATDSRDPDAPYRDRPYQDSPYQDPGAAGDPPRADRPLPRSRDPYGDSAAPGGRGGPIMLTAREPNSPINIRDQASTASPVRYLGYPGDPIQISDRMRGDDGYTWYKVQFQSGAAGWVRGDFIGNLGNR